MVWYGIVLSLTGRTNNLDSVNVLTWRDQWRATVCLRMIVLAGNSCKIKSVNEQFAL